MKNTSLSAAFEAAGYRLENPRNQWSAVREDGAIAVTVWSDQIDKSSEPWVLDVRHEARLAEWITKPGNTVRKRHLELALRTRGGVVDLVLVKAVDPKVEPRRVEWARAWPERRGWIDPESFDPAKGTFRLELRPADRKG